MEKLRYYPEARCYSCGHPRKEHNVCEQFEAECGLCDCPEHLDRIRIEIRLFGKRTRILVREVEGTTTITLDE